MRPRRTPALRAAHRPDDGLVDHDARPGRDVDVEPGRGERLLRADRPGRQRRARQHHAQVRRREDPRGAWWRRRQAQRDEELGRAGVPGGGPDAKAPAGHGQHHLLGVRLQAHGLQDVRPRGARAAPPEGPEGRVRGRARRAVLDAARLLRQAAPRPVPRGPGRLLGRRDPRVLLPQQRDAVLRHPRRVPHGRSQPVLRGLRGWCRGRPLPRSLGSYCFWGEVVILLTGRFTFRVCMFNLIHT